RAERIIACVEVGTQGTDTASSSPIWPVARLRRSTRTRRGAAENHIKSWKTHLAADRTSCTRAPANQLPLFLHAGAYGMMWGLRAAMPKRSSFG
ncbi:MAG: IS1380 family transposase, partial [Mesorhizobium sp.]